MNLINTVEKQANVDEYVDTLMNVFTAQEEKIAAMKSRLVQFKDMLKEESELSAKIAQINQPTSNENLSYSASNANSVIGTAQKVEEIAEDAM